MRGKSFWLPLVLCLILLLCACGTAQESPVMSSPAAEETETEPTAVPTAEPGPEPTPEPVQETVPEPTAEPETTKAEEEETTMLAMKIGDTEVAVAWEENESAEALKELCREAPLTVSLSMYGGFEQVGPLGTALPRSDVQTTTEAGDIVLYAGNQIVVFYGSNSWAYTRLGHITDQSAADMAALLANGDVTLTLYWK